MQDNGHSCFSGALEKDDLFLQVSIIFNLEFLSKEFIILRRFSSMSGLLGVFPKKCESILNVDR